MARVLCRPTLACKPGLRVNPCSGLCDGCRALSMPRTVLQIARSYSSMMPPRTSWRRALPSRPGAVVHGSGSLEPLDRTSFSLDGIPKGCPVVVVGRTEFMAPPSSCGADCLVLARGAGSPLHLAGAPVRDGSIPGAPCSRSVRKFTPDDREPIFVAPSSPPSSAGRCHSEWPSRLEANTLNRGWQRAQQFATVAVRRPLATVIRR